MNLIGFAFVAGGLVVAGGAFAADIPLTVAQQQNLGIRMATVEALSEHPLATLAATVAPARDSRTVIVVPFTGTVTKVIALEGQAVNRGARLASIFSRDLLAVQSELTRAEAELKLAETTAGRARLLASEGVIAGARAEEAEARVVAMRAQANEQRHLLGAAQIDRGRPGTYVLTAPSQGRISTIEIEPGSPVDAMSRAIVIDRADKLWLEAQLPLNLVGKIEPGDAVLAANVRGKVVAAGITADPKTRSVILRAEVPASVGLIPGSAVQMTVFAPAENDVVGVPAAAVVNIDGADTVFVATTGGFQDVPVTVISRTGTSAAIRGAVKPGQRIATAGISELKVLSVQD